MGISRTARRQLGQAVYLEQVGDLRAAEDKGRAALVTFRSAMDWAEDGPRFDDAHGELDDAGRWVRETFGCHLVQEGSTYFQACPVALAHNRIGMSVGAIVKRAECSICRADPEDCEHITGRVYDGERCIRVLCELEILDVSIVSRPAQPDARITRVSVSSGELREALGPAWKAGMPVSCDRCLNECSGVADPFGGH